MTVDFCFSLLLLIFVLTKFKLKQTTKLTWNCLRPDHWLPLVGYHSLQMIERACSLNVTLLSHGKHPGKLSINLLFQKLRFWFNPERKCPALACCVSLAGAIEVHSVSFDRGRQEVAIRQCDNLPSITYDKLRRIIFALSLPVRLPSFFTC